MKSSIVSKLILNVCSWWRKKRKFSSIAIYLEKNRNRNKSDKSQQQDDHRKRISDKKVRHRKQQKNNSAKLRSWKTPLPKKGKKCPPPEQTTKSPSSSQQVENTIPAGNTQLDSIVVVVEVVVNSQEARENETKRGRKKDKGKKITCRKPAGRRELNDRVLITV